MANKDFPKYSNQHILSENQLQEKKGELEKEFQRYLIKEGQQKQGRPTRAKENNSSIGFRSILDEMVKDNATKEARVRDAEARKHRGKNEADMRVNWVSAVDVHE
jgi:hypothetical protein